MSLNEQQSKAGRIPMWAVDIDVPFCAKQLGQSNGVGGMWGDCFPRTLRAVNRPSWPNVAGTYSRTAAMTAVGFTEADDASNPTGYPKIATRTMTGVSTGDFQFGAGGALLRLRTDGDLRITIDVKFGATVAGSVYCSLVRSAGVLSFNLLSVTGLASLIISGPPERLFANVGGWLFYSWNNIGSETLATRMYMDSGSAVLDVAISGAGNCDLSYGSAPEKPACYNTRATCINPTAYQQTTRTIRTCEARDDMPFGRLPLVRSVDIAPGVVKVGGGLGSRASVTVALYDLPYKVGTVIPVPYSAGNRPEGAETNDGTFWAKLLARYRTLRGSTMTVRSGYIQRGDSGDVEFSSENALNMVFQLDDATLSGGTLTLVSKDPLKMADDKRAQVPAQSPGRLAAALPHTTSATTVAVAPAGAGASYPTSGVAIIDKELMTFTRSGDSFTFAGRGSFGTEVADHAIDATVQVCFRAVAQTPAAIAKTLLTTYAGVPAAYIPDAEWSAEITNYIPYLFDALITKPTAVADALKDLGVEAMCDFYWDERVGKIKLNAVKPAPTDAPVWDDDNTFDAATDVSVSEAQGERVSTVVVHFDPIDRTGDLSNPNNYRQTYVEIDPDSVAVYGGHAIRTVFSRYIAGNNRAAAERLAKIMLGRFKYAPRALEFTVAPKDAAVWTGDCVFVRHHRIQSPTGATVVRPFQVQSVRNLGDIHAYRALEWFNPPVSPAAELLVVIDVPMLNLRDVASEMALPVRTLRDVFNARFSVAPDGRTVRFRFGSNALLGSALTSLPALDVGDWPTPTTVIVELQPGARVYGAGGKGGNGGPPGGILPAGSINGGAGGLALRTSRSLTLINNGSIAGGGGGGGGGRGGGSSSISGGGGGGGRGYSGGDGGTGYTAPYNGGAGSATARGLGVGNGGHGGELAAAGNGGGSTSSGTGGTGGAAGAAIVGLSYIALSGSGTITGATS